MREVILLMRSELEQNRIKLDAQFDDDLPLVWADRIQLQQVGLNLIINAIESMKEAARGNELCW